MVVLVDELCEPTHTGQCVSDANGAAHAGAGVESFATASSAAFTCAQR
jgi:hypothetical protein